MPRRVLLGELGSLAVYIEQAIVVIAAMGRRLAERDATCVVDVGLGDALHVPARKRKQPVYSCPSLPEPARASCSVGISSGFPQCVAMLAQGKGRPKMDLVRPGTSRGSRLQWAAITAQTVASSDHEDPPRMPGHRHGRIGDGDGRRGERWVKVHRTIKTRTSCYTSAV